MHSKELKSLPESLAGDSALSQSTGEAIQDYLERNLILEQGPDLFGQLIADSILTQEEYGLLE